MRYSIKFKRRVLSRLLSPGAPPITRLSDEVGVPKDTLYRWRNDSLEAAVAEDEALPDDTPKPRSELTAIDKARLLMEADGLDDEERGAFLRRHGIRQIDLTQWRTALEEALDPAIAKKRRADDKKLLAAMEKELRRKDKALAEAAALLVLRKKARALLGGEDDDTDLS